MKVVIGALSLSVLLAGCSHERSPYTAVDETNNPPQIEPSLTNRPITPVSDRTNSQGYPDQPAQTNR